MASLEEALGLEEEATSGTSGTSLESALGLEPEKPKPGLGRRLAGAAIEGIKDIAIGLPMAAGSLAKTMGMSLLPPPLRPESYGERVSGTAKGLASSATLGLYQPELTETEAAAAPGGGLVAGVATGGAISKGVTPLAQQLAAKLGPAVGKVASNVISKVAETGAYTTPAALQALLTGEDPVEASVRGLSAAGVGATVAGLSKQSAKVLGKPASRGMERETFNDVMSAQAFRDWKYQMELFNQVKQRNAAALDAHKAAVAQAQLKLANGEAGAAEAYHKALLSHKSAEKQMMDIESNLSREAQKLRPKMTPEEAYAEYNAARATPDMLPEIELTNTAETAHRLGGGLTQSTEGLPKSAGPGGVIEKLATGLDEAIGETPGATAHPEALKYFGDKWKTMSDADKLKVNQQFTQQLGISGDDVSLLSSGKLRLDQADRLLQLIGPNAGSSGLASRLYWSIMEDLRGSKDPMAQGLLKAKAVQRQDIAAGDVARMLRVVPDKYGRPTVEPGAVKKLNSMFENYEKDPRLLKWDERVLVESVPAAERAELLQTFAGLFKQRSIVAETKKGLKQAKKVELEKVPKPKLEAEVFPEPPEAVFLKEQPLQWMSRQEQMQMESNIYFAMRAAGMPIPSAVASSRLINIVPQWLFKIGMTPNGREFIKGLYKDTSVNIGDTAKLGALANYIRVHDQQQQADQQQREKLY